MTPGYAKLFDIYVGCGETGSHDLILHMKYLGRDLRVEIPEKMFNKLEEELDRARHIRNIRAQPPESENSED